MELLAPHSREIETDQNVKRPINVPERMPVVPEVGTIVPKPLLYKPVLAPEVNFVGGVEKFPRPIGVVSVEYSVRLKMFANSTRTFRL
jgi:hypothetical protein